MLAVSLVFLPPSKIHSNGESAIFFRFGNKIEAKLGRNGLNNMEQPMGTREKQKKNEPRE